jgi:hypothetical protein
LPKKSSPKYLFDLHAVIKALSGGNNLVRSAFISGLESGEVLIQRSVTKELKDVDEAVYKDFQRVNPGRVSSKHKTSMIDVRVKGGSFVKPFLRPWFGRFEPGENGAKRVASLAG